MIPPEMLKLAAEKGMESAALNPKAGDIPTFADKTFSDVGSDVPRFEKDSNIPKFAENEADTSDGQTEAADPETSEGDDSTETAGEQEANYDVNDGIQGNSADDTENPEQQTNSDHSIETENSGGETCQNAEVDPEDRIENDASDDEKPIDSSRIDDNGNVYKDENGELLPNTTYEVNGTRYTTDELGRITRAEGYLKDTPDNERDNSAQSDAGGKDRKPGDDGGHLRARMNGGSSGNENLVAMRDTINRGDYKRSENEENQMLKDGKQVYERIDITYDDNSSRPSKIEKTYTDGEKTVKLTVDNVEGSTDLLENLNGEISDQDLSNLTNEIEDMRADGNEVSVTSVRKEYDGDGNLKSVAVCVTNETTGEKDYTTYAPNGEKGSNE